MTRNSAREPSRRGDRSRRPSRSLHFRREARLQNSGSGPPARGSWAIGARPHEGRACSISEGSAIRGVALFFRRLIRFQSLSDGLAPYSISLPAGSSSGSGPSSRRHLNVTVRGATATLTSTPAEALTIQPLLFALAVLRTTKNEAASRRRESSDIKAS